MAINATAPIPAPIPAFAPVLSPPLVEPSDGEGVELEDEVGVGVCSPSPTVVPEPAWLSNVIFAEFPPNPSDVLGRIFQ